MLRVYYCLFIILYLYLRIGNLETGDKMCDKILILIDSILLPGSPWKK